MAERPDPEPKLLDGLAPFEEGDFHALSETLARDPQYNDRRLVARRKLGTIAQAAVKAIERGTEGEVALLQRTSLHQPHQFNGMRVRRLWSYICRGKKEKTRLKQVIGPELAKDLDAAYRNAYLCVALEADVVEVSLRIHKDAWYDGQNVINRVRKEGPAQWIAILNKLDGYRLRMDDWKGEWPCGRLDAGRIEEYLKYYKPGDHSMAVEFRIPAPAGNRGPALDPDLPESLILELERLVPLYRHMVWSQESDFLFSR
ncbi:MAG TPA: hypothetical protein VM509_05375 [Planctomycetota bacterium]|nr:hypothetical protein [Planctomycetota bacterium]